MPEPGKLENERFPLQKIVPFNSVTTQTEDSEFIYNKNPFNQNLPYHERVLRYYDLRRKIFCETFTLSSPRNRTPKRNTIRCRNFWKKVVESRKKLNYSINAIERENNDVRPYIRIRILNMDLIGLIDTGASISCISGLAAKSLLEKNIPYRKLHEMVTTAGGSQYKVYGVIEEEIEFRDLRKNIKFYIIPELKNELYLGIDFVNSFKILNLNTSLLEIKELYRNGTENCHKLTPEMQKSLDNIISIFPSFERDGLGKTTLLEHTIELEKDARPVKQRYFSISPAVEKLVHDEIDNMLKLGIIEVAPPNCPWSSPVTLVRKNGKSRLCLDSRRLNAVTVRDAYPQPKISNILSRLPKAEFITSLDLKHAFWQIGLAANSRDMTAFTVPNSLYEITSI